MEVHFSSLERKTGMLTFKKKKKIAQMMVANYNFSDLRLEINLANVHLVSELPATT